MHALLKATYIQSLTQVIAWYLLIIILVGSASKAQKCVNLKGKEVDWWFISKNARGWTVDYWDSSSTKVIQHDFGSNLKANIFLKDHFDEDELDYDNIDREKTIAYFFANDQPEDGASFTQVAHTIKESSDIKQIFKIHGWSWKNAHSKWALGLKFGETTTKFTRGFMIQHAVPQSPAPRIVENPDDQLHFQFLGDNGKDKSQHLTCISFKDPSQITEIVKALAITKPNIITTNFEKDDFYTVFKGNNFASSKDYTVAFKDALATPFPRRTDKDILKAVKTNSDVVAMVENRYKNIDLYQDCWKKWQELRNLFLPSKLIGMQLDENCFKKISIQGDKITMFTFAALPHNIKLNADEAPETNKGDKKKNKKQKAKKKRNNDNIDQQTGLPKRTVDSDAFKEYIEKKGIYSPNRMISPATYFGPIQWAVVANNLKTSLFVSCWGNDNLPSILTRYSVYLLDGFKIDADSYTHGQTHDKIAIAVSKDAKSKPENDAFYVCSGDSNHRMSEISHAGTIVCIKDEAMWRWYRAQIGDHKTSAAKVTVKSEFEQTPEEFQYPLQETYMNSLWSKNIVTLDAVGKLAEDLNLEISPAVGKTGEQYNAEEAAMNVVTSKRKRKGIDDDKRPRKKQKKGHDILQATKNTIEPISNEPRRSVRIANRNKSE